ncbi:MAG: energy-coupling factor ABC transporter permease [Zoogloea sp.]|nr:energy-coupling factor ABC transporter permease [Zoogloea sp.]
MHIEPGYVASAKILAANAAAIALVGSQSVHLLKAPTLIVRSLLAAVFFTVAMQAFHLPVGPSELHFLGAMPLYLSLGFIPTLFGFAIGLLVQGLFFDPSDLVHLGVNFLSLALPLVLVHATFGQRLDTMSVRSIMKLDAAYYTGVTLMVGFWLALGDVATPLSAWATFAASYASIVAVEPVITLLVLQALARRQGSAPLRHALLPRSA